VRTLAQGLRRKSSNSRAIFFGGRTDIPQHQRSQSGGTNVTGESKGPTRLRHLRKTRILIPVTIAALTPPGNIDPLAIDFQLQKVREKGPVVDAVETLRALPNSSSLSSPQTTWDAGEARSCFPARKYRRWAERSPHRE
jgi:hypothetical protein